jgi:hypothetical protein
VLFFHASFYLLDWFANHSIKSFYALDIMSIEPDQQTQEAELDDAATETGPKVVHVSGKVVIGVVHPDKVEYPVPNLNHKLILSLQVINSSIFFLGGAGWT